MTGEIETPVPSRRTGRELDSLKRLIEIETAIETGRTTFVTTVGPLLAEVQAKELYRVSGYESFSDYCRGRWALSRSSAYELVAHASLMQSLSAIAETPLPANVGQARELTGLPVEIAARVLRAAATGGRLTAASIRTARTRLAEPALAIDTDTSLQARALTDQVITLADEMLSDVQAKLDSGTPAAWLLYHIQKELEEPRNYSDPEAAEAINAAVQKVWRPVIDLLSARALQELMATYDGVLNEAVPPETRIDV